MRRSMLSLVAAAALAAAFAVAPSADATTGTSYVWSGGSTGGDNTSWSDANNWTPGGVPGDGDSVSIDSPDASHQTAHVTAVPTVTLVAFSISQNPNRLGVSITGGAITVSGSFTWNGGVISTPVTLEASSVATISGSNSRLDELAANLTVAGSITLSGLTGSGASDTGALRIDDPHTVTVEAGATLTSAGPNNVTEHACCVTPAKVINHGTVTADSGDLTVSGVEFDQHGTLHASSGARLVTMNAPLTAASGAHYTGSGGWLIESVPSAKLIGTQTLGSAFHLEFGGLAVDSGALLGGTATFAGTGTIDWTGGTIEGNFTIGHGVHMQVSGAHTGNGHRVLSGDDELSGGIPATVTNHGTMVFANGATVGTAAEAKLINASDGTLSIAPGVQFSSGSCCLNPDQIVNNGTVTVPTGTTTAPAEIKFIAYRSTGTTSVAPGRTMLLDGGASGRLSGAALTGSGSLELATPMTVSGTNTVAAAATLTLSLHGSLNGTSVIGGAGSLKWNGGSFSGAVTVGVGGGTEVSGPDAKAVLNVNGGSTPSKLTFTTGVSIASGTSAHHDGIAIGFSTLTLDATTTVGNFVDLPGGNLVNTGTLKIQTGKVERGASNSMTNRGTLAIASGGSLDIVGSYTQTAAGTLTVDLAPHAHALLSVHGSVSLSGKLEAHDDGAYNPAVGTRLPVVDASSISLSLSCVVTSGAGAASRHWAASSTPTGVVLTRRAGARRVCG